MKVKAHTFVNGAHVINEQRTILDTTSVIVECLETEGQNVQVEEDEEVTLSVGTYDEQVEIGKFVLDDITIKEGTFRKYVYKFIPCP